MQVLKTLVQVRRFLECVNYFRKFIPHSANKQSHLMELAKKDTISSELPNVKLIFFSIFFFDMFIWYHGTTFPHTGQKNFDKKCFSMHSKAQFIAEAFWRFTFISPKVSQVF